MDLLMAITILGSGSQCHNYLRSYHQLSPALEAYTALLLALDLHLTIQSQVVSHRSSQS
jgi:hypothetical protein